MTDQTISTPETREREVAALKHQVRDMANERNKAEQDVRDLRAEVEWLKQENARIISVARPYENNLNELRAQLAQVEQVRDEYHASLLDALESEDQLRQRVTVLTEALKNLVNEVEGCTVFHLADLIGNTNLSVLVKRLREAQQALVTPGVALVPTQVCEHQWGIDGMHNNEYCKICFVNREAKP